MIIDEVAITVEAGAGGNGCLSFRREKFIPRGGPDGGNGGRGGDIFLEARLDVHTLIDFTYHPLFEAKHGEHGKGKNMHGKDSSEIVIGVPVGTMVYDDQKQLIVDMNQQGQRHLIAKGGRGGRGNTTFTSSIRQTPRLAEKGEPGEKKNIRLELKLLADVGLVGFPNAGKSTLISRVTHAKPKIADYPFTTLEPHLGVVQLSENRSFVMADVPGLIEGASKGKGLGTRFLKHLERTKVLLQLVELTGSDNISDLESRIQVIQKEIKQYGSRLSQTPQLLVLTKADILGDRASLEKWIKKIEKKWKKVFVISAVSGEGLKGLMEETWKHLSAIWKTEQQTIVPAVPTLYQTKPRFQITKEGDVFFVSGSEVEKWVAMTNFNTRDAFERFQKIMKRMGVVRELKKLGAKEGDMLYFGDRALVYSSDGLEADDEN
jgi:GTP-binding protein